jgi:hypothetical protein
LPACKVDSVCDMHANGDSPGVAVLVWVAFIASQLRSGEVLGVWWQGYPRISRQDRPGAYWLILAIQGALFLNLLIHGRSSPVR